MIRAQCYTIKLLNKSTCLYTQYCSKKTKTKFIYTHDASKMTIGYMRIARQIEYK